MDTDYQELDLLSFLDELDINYETSGKNIGPGWVAINPCPNCGDDRNHFAINIGNKSISCWVCSYTGTIIKFIMRHFNIDQDQAENLIKGHLEEVDLMQDQDLETLVHKTFTKKPKVIEEIPPFQKLEYLPGDPITAKMLEERPKLSSFLKKRGIPLYLCKKYNFRYDYRKSMRLIMPIHSKDGKLIAYQGRDITGRAMLPYITQPKDAPIGRTLFNIGEWQRDKCVILEEGIIDCIVTIANINRHYKIYKDKFCVLACFRNKPTQEQAELIEKSYKILSFLDMDSWWNSRELNELCLNADIECLLSPPNRDPASLTEDEFLSLDLPSYLY